MTPLQNTPRTKVVVSVVTHNNAGCLPDLLKILSSQSGVDAHCYIFDNASVDGTCDSIDKPDRLTVHASKTNIGYGRGHNFNFAHSDSEYVVVLNADLRFGPDVLRELVDYLDSNPDVAVAGPSVFEGRSGMPFPPRRFYPGEGMIPIERGIKRPEIAWINGCCMLIRRSAFEEIDGFDEDYFLYQAETDLCLRLRRRGHRVGHVENAVVHHLHRQSQRDITEYEYGRRLFDGSALFWQKHYSPEDVAAIARFQHSVSTVLLGLSAPLTKLIRRSAFERDRLRARRDVCGELLRSPSLRELPARVAPIYVRQSRLAMEWVRQGRFPLDDY